MRSDKEIIKGMKQEHDRLIEMGREAQAENARLQERIKALDERGMQASFYIRLCVERDGYKALAERFATSLHYKDVQ